jgi:type I restriction enzyme S subunit
VRDGAAAYSVDGEISTTENVPPGYKQTEVGVIPKDWAIQALDTLCDVRDGTHESPQFVSAGIPLVTSKNITTGHIDLDDVSYISEQDAELINRRSKVDVNDILMSMIGTIGSGVLIEFEPNFCIKNVALIKPRYVLPIFLIQLIKSPQFQAYVHDSLDGGIQKFVSLGKLRKLNIPSPSSTEQRAIATALSDVDTLIDVLDRLIAKKRDIKQATMQQLLTGETRLPGFEGEWETKRLGEVGKIVTGGTPPTLQKCFWGGIHPWITPTDISSGRDVNESPRLLTEEGLKLIGELPPDTVLVTCIASIGKNAILRKRGGCNQQINAIIPDQSHCSEFIYYLIENNKSRLIGRAGITATRILSKENFAMLGFAFPSIKEQTAIATVLSDMDAEIEALERGREKTKQVKQGMMQELLTGRTRLVPSEAGYE